MTSNMSYHQVNKSHLLTNDPDVEITRSVYVSVLIL